MFEAPISLRSPLERFVDALTLGGEAAPALLVQLEADRAAVALKPSGTLLVALDARAPQTWDELAARARGVLGTEKPDVLAGIVPGVAAVVLLGSELGPEAFEDAPRNIHWIIVRPNGEMIPDARPLEPRNFPNLVRAFDEAVRNALARTTPASNPAAREALERAGEDALTAEARFRALMASRRAAPWTLGIVVACVAVTAIEFFRGADTRAALVAMGALVGKLALHGHPEMLLAYGFLHGGILHIGMNMLALRAVGRDLETIIGGRRLLVVFTLSVLGGGLLVSLVNPDQLVVGASAGIFGVITALLGIALRGGGEIPELARRRIRNSIVGTLLLNLGISLLPQVSLLGHLGGSIVGVALGFSGLLTAGLDLPWRAPPDPARERAMAAFYRAAAAISIVALAASVIVAWVRGA